LVTDAITNIFFTTSEVANANLRLSGVPAERICFVGNTMIDTLLANLDQLRAPPFWVDLGLSPRNYFAMTLHRPSNVDDPKSLERLLLAVAEVTRGMPVLFPVHPRTAKTLQAIAVPPSIKPVEPQPYLEFNYLVRHAKAVITDSGGVTEETTVMGVPCITLRDSTERPETVTVGTNELVGTDPSQLKPYLDRLFSGRWKRGAIPEKWDGKTGMRIALELERRLDAAPPAQ
jgi:UDP-N-acetylglucosamine 2-epimerase (non-hydrolysing)